MRNTNKKALILKTSQVLFAQFGLKKVTTDEIANQAGVSKATVYKYYRNKYEIFNDIVQFEFDQLLTTIREAVANEVSIIEKFRAHLLTKIEKLRKLINFYRVTQEEWGDYWPYVEDIRQRFMEEEKKIVRDILRLGNETGELDVKNVDLAAHIITVALKSVEFPWAIETQEMTVPDYVNMMLSMLMEGLKKRETIANG
ncbi:MAG: TetR/AcrR family transcriptional regulator [candidate division Zixibacteria bacterium]|nr:TetR/AcrR family transcriptional regulator [candidate division Zixibacteria bacterium]